MSHTAAVAEAGEQSRSLRPNGLNLADIHPRKGAKFSPNLHKFLSSRYNANMRKYAHVYRDADGTLWIGFPDDYFLIGRRLASVLCSAEGQIFAHSNLGPLTEVTDFWANYVRVGRCAIDSEHQHSFINDETRWEVHGDSRSCLWCGKVHQKLERIPKTVIHEVWSNV